MNIIDFLLIYPPYSYPKKSPPIGLAYIAAVLEKEGYSVEIADMSVLGMDYNDLQQKIMEIKPTIVGVSFMTNQYDEAINISNLVKDIDSNIIVLVGGPHVSALPEEVVSLESIDIAVIGEGEITILEVASNLLDRNRDSDEIEAINGIAYKKQGKIHINNPRQLIQDMDSIPFPAWPLLPINRYSIPATGGEAAENVFAIISSRGCPNQCVFCDSHTIFGRKFRTRSAQNIFDELVYLNEHFGATQFDFVDDTMTVNKNRIYSLCNLIINNKPEFKWMCNSRVNTVDLEMLKLMKKAGCVRVEFGVESGDPDVLKKCKKGIKIEQIKNAHAMAREAGLSIGSFVMVGNLGENFSAVKKTKNLLEQLDTDDIFISITTPFPGTEIYKIAQHNDWLRNHNWSEYVTSPTYFPNYRPIMETDKMNANEILEAFFYLHSRFAIKKFKTRYGRFFFLNIQFYKDYILSVRNGKELLHKMKMAIKLLRIH
ncbi:B12-binding domain-containing radical SAM protein [Candidatus Latescibacterota bacterium]